MKAKFDKSALLLAVSLFWNSALPALAQNSQILWSAFTVGFGAATSGNTAVTSAVGQPLAGTSTDGSSAVTGGLLANPVVSGPVTAVDDAPADIPLPSTFELEQNYPNPFNPATAIRFSLPHATHVTLEVFNVLGQKVAGLVSERRAAGNHVAFFDATGLPSGIYVYRLTAGQLVLTKKMLFIQ
ncbi:MAG TPA: T9SS type A sorting domain-containing protein [bacterium]